MPARRIVPLAAITALVFAEFAPATASAGSPNIVVAQAEYATTSRPIVHRRPPTRITVYRTDRLYRDCNTFYQVQHRPSGDVIYPQINCQWSAR
jgi:hypothetical protein